MRNGRLPWLRPDELDDDQRALYDRIVGGPRASGRPTPLVDAEGRLYGPFNALLTNPGVGEAVQAVGAALRFAGALPRPLFELIVLTVARERGASYEWYAHEPLARRAGVSDAQLQAVRAGKMPELGTEGERSVFDLVTVLLRHEDPGAELVQSVEDAFGSGVVTEVVATVGFYDLIAALMQVWDAQLPEGVQGPLA